MRVTLCDIREGKEPCGERASVEVQLRWADKNWVLDACDRHSKELTANAREAEAPAAPSPYTSTTRLPKAGPKRDTIDRRVKDWSLAQGGDLAASVNNRGRQPKELKERFLASPEGVVWSNSQH